MPRDSEDSRALEACANVLRVQQDAIVRSLVEKTVYCQKNRFQDTPDQLRERVAGSLALLIEHLRGRDGYGALYTGQRVFELIHLEQTRQENLNYCRRAVTDDERVFESTLAPHVSAAALEQFKVAFRKVTNGLVSEAPRHVRTLFIGDCLLQEVISFIIGPLLNEGLSIDPFPVNPRDTAQLERILDSLSTKEFDVVFFSPFSHARVAELEALMDLRRSLASSAEIDVLIDSVVEQTRLLLDDIVSRFECPIFVHNAGLVTRSNGAAKLSARLLLTRRARQRAGERINRWLADYVVMANSMTHRHLFVIDETAIVNQFGRRALGQYLNTSAYQHSVVLSRHLAGEYRARINAVGRLLGKKLVICDLDNTLWDGVIGEGPVAHFHDRQRSLKRLKENAGIVLSIASKNDPGNVHLTGGTLRLEDFVAPQISWRQKSSAVATIKQTLNLQTRHMVFLDDRPDERAMVQEVFPDLLTLDPCDPESWRLIDLWGEISFGSSDLDRTKLYQDQALRDAFEASDTLTQSRSSDSLERLGLVITIDEAKRSELKRVTELINRTNQWNLCGTRTSFAEVRKWHDSPNTHVLLANVVDRFGDMGTVCVSVVNQSETAAEILVFVLSCRVFGYGVESAMLREIVRRCEIGGRRSLLKGHFRSNTQNQPCRNMYADHGFVVAGDSYDWTGAPALPKVSWAEVRVSP
jgi:FkbH-like protein